MKPKRDCSLRAPRSRAPWIAGFLLATLLGPQAQAEEPARDRQGVQQQVQEESFPVGDLAPKGPEPARVFVGASVGKGAGLYGGFLAYRPSDHFGVEAGIGRRLFVVEGATDEEFYPTAYVGKMQFHFRGPEERYQSGFEAGLMYAADVGAGGELAYFGRLRLGADLFFDFNLGVAFLPDIERRQLDYVVEKMGGERWEWESVIKPTPVALMWGLGFGFAL
jgi:hypothetical protein